MAGMGSDESWVGVEEVAAHLRVARDSVYRWIETRRLPAHRVGRLLRFKLSEVDAWVQTGSGKGSRESGSDSPFRRGKQRRR